MCRRPRAAAFGGIDREPVIIRGGPGSNASAELTLRRSSDLLLGSAALREFAVEIAAAGSDGQFTIADADIERPPLRVCRRLNRNQVLMPELGENLKRAYPGAFGCCRPEKISASPLG